MHKTKREYVSPLLSPNDCVYMNVTVLILDGVLMVLKCPLRLSISVKVFKIMLYFIKTIQ